MFVQDGSLGAASDMSAATGCHHLNRRFGSLAFASSNSLSDLTCAQQPHLVVPFGPTASAPPPLGAATQGSMQAAMQGSTFNLSEPTASGQDQPQHANFGRCAYCHYAWSARRSCCAFNGDVGNLRNGTAECKVIVIACIAWNL